MNNNLCYEILLTYSCNARCLFCSQGDFDKSKNAPFTQIVKEIYKAKKMGYTKLGLSGGEPTIREDLPEIIKVASKIGFKSIRIQTNGIRLADFNYAKKLKESGLTFCKFSFVSENPKIHNMLVSRLGAWEDAVKGLENINRLKIRLGNNILINKFNYNKLKRLVNFLLNKGVSNFVVIYPIYIGNMFLNKKIGVPLNRCSRYFIDIVEYLEKKGLGDEILFLNVPPCFLKKYWQSAIGLNPFNTLVTSPDGKTINLDESSNLNKKKSKVCKNCILNSKCSGINANYASIFGFKGIIPINQEKDTKKDFSSKYLTDNEKCLIEILKIKNNIPTETVIKMASKIPLCKDCSDGNNVINAAARLVTKKIIEMEFKNGKYFFKLKTDI
ncbi:MAG: radical SAM protein [Elusimicrobiota bacterium]